jgi:hypothetical protein
LPSQAKQALQQHLIVSDWYGYDAAEDARIIQIYVKNMKLISETKVENEADLTVLRSQLHNSNDFQVLVIVFTYTCKSRVWILYVYYRPRTRSRTLRKMQLW